MSGLPRERESVLGCEPQPPCLGNALLPEVGRRPPAQWSQGILLNSPGQGDQVCENHGDTGERGELGRTVTDPGHRGWLTSGQPKGLEGHPRARKSMSLRGVSTWSYHPPGPDEEYPAGCGSTDCAALTPGTRSGGAWTWSGQGVDSHGYSGGVPGPWCRLWDETQTRGLTADRPSPWSWRRASGASCVQGLPRAAGHAPFCLRQGCWRPWLWQRHPPLAPSSHDVSLGDCVCEGLSRCSTPSAQPVTSARCQFPNKATFWGSGRDVSLGGSPFTQDRWFGD